MTYDDFYYKTREVVLTDGGNVNPFYIPSEYTEALAIIKSTTEYCKHEATQNFGASVGANKLSIIANIIIVISSLLSFIYKLDTLTITALGLAWLVYLRIRYTIHIKRYKKWTKRYKDISSIMIAAPNYEFRQQPISYCPVVFTTLQEMFAERRDRIY